MQNNKLYLFMIVLLSVVCFYLFNKTNLNPNIKELQPILLIIDTTKIPTDEFGKMVKYGRELMINTAQLIGPNGSKGSYLGNKMNCTNCHQNAGTKPYSFNLIKSHQNYPQFRGREGKVLSLAERVNNCIMRPHNGKPLPLDSKEMLAFLSYLKWINDQVKTEKIVGEKNLSIIFPSNKASTENGKTLYVKYCKSCHGENGEGQLNLENTTYIYPPLWGKYGYQPSSSMHRVIKHAQWIKANMPYGLATWNKPILTDNEALDIAAFVNNDSMHKRPSPKTLDYPIAVYKAIDYAHGPFIDTFSEKQHKYGPFTPIIKYWESKNLKPIY